ncbi:hypothetical protein B296_00039532 [Ensete ventricosum]|uniref:Uncharacterized protein n=1 Tax=Ensete ventricosum TaxID=4639 RepID=A0A426XLZ0_ENSVE|nr:hypothetical protein B296_00039532 [Ensete ventricosum]
MQCSLISGYFHDFTEERTMMLKVFLDDDLRSMAHDRKKEQEKRIYMTPTVMMPYISMLSLPERGNVFVLGVDTSNVRINVTLMQYEDEDSEPSEESLKLKDESMEEEPQPTDYAMHALAAYSNP